MAQMTTPVRLALVLSLWNLCAWIAAILAPGWIVMKNSEEETVSVGIFYTRSCSQSSCETTHYYGSVKTYVVLAIQMESVLAVVCCAAGCLILLVNVNAITPSKAVTGGIPLCLAATIEFIIIIRWIAVNLDGRDLLVPYFIIIGLLGFLVLFPACILLLNRYNRPQGPVGDGNQELVELTTDSSL
ncbi:uncharacterized protein LOC125647587 isoform X2 [Ostrea edulis]|nr:uncharacterized protein LOC125647587 isoform X2 [Ostrea edulis]